MAEVEIQTERVDDIPLLVHQQQMGIPEVLGNVICPHGNRQGISIGWLATGWISYILSEADDRISEVESWAAKQRRILTRLTVVQLPEQVIRHVTPLSELQQRILALLGLPVAVYENMASVHL